MSRLSPRLLLCILGLVFVPVPGVADETRLAWEPDLTDETQVRAYEELQRYMKNDKVRPYLEQAYGYAILPVFFRIAAGWGLNYGRGIVIESGELVGRTTTWQGTLGFTFGVESHSQIILFRNQATMAKWQKGWFEFQGRASVSAIFVGGATDPGFKPDVAIFSRDKTGLMIEAAAILAKYNYKAVL